VLGMKYSIDFTNRFKKSLRKGVKRGLDPILIEKAVEKLANEGKLPPSYKSIFFMAGAFVPWWLTS
jgi:mRNA-degrading endonuclease YafQ of YafQ-DinJ toxin-antitoxin module